VERHLIASPFQSASNAGKKAGKGISIFSKEYSLHMSITLGKNIRKLKVIVAN
jgi:hypothetical protein